MLYFVQNVILSKNFEQLGFKKIDNEYYEYIKDNSLWKEKKLLDLGFGKGDGLYRFPILSFNQLLPLVFVKYKENKNIDEVTFNLWGALAVLIDDYSYEFISYIKSNFCKGEFINKFPFVYRYLNTEFNVSESMMRKMSDKKLAECCRMWVDYNLSN